MNKNNNLTIFLILTAILISSLSGIAWYIYEKNIENNNQTILLSEIKNNIMERKYSKAYSVAKVLKDKFPKNRDILLLEENLKDLSEENNLEIKDEKSKIAKETISKLEGIEIASRENLELNLDFNNRYIEDNVIIENYSNLNEPSSLPKSEIDDFLKEKEVEKLNLKERENPNILKEKMERERESAEREEVKIKALSENLKENKVEEREKTVKVEREIVKPKENIIDIEVKNGKIERPYSYSIRKELYEILDYINTYKKSKAIDGLKNMIERGLDKKFESIIKLLGLNEIEKASNGLLSLIKKDVEPHLDLSLIERDVSKNTNNRENESDELAKKQVHTLYKEAERKNKINSAPRAKIDIKNFNKKDESYYELAIKKFKEKLYEEAADLFKLEIEVNRDNLKAYNNLAISLHKLKKLKEAKDILKRAINFNTNYHIAYYNLGNINEEMGEQEEALKNYQEAYKIKNLAKYALKIGIINNSIKNFKEAEKILENAMKTYNEEEREILLYNLALAKYKNFKTKDALSLINEALEIGEREEALYLRGTINLEEKNLKNAIDDFSKALKLNSLNISTRINLSKALEENNEISKAIKILEEIKDLNLGIIFNNLALLYEKNGEREKALDYISRAINFNFQDAKYNKALILIKDDKLNEAKSLLVDYLKTNANNINAIYNLGILEYNEKKDDKYLKEFIKKAAFDDTRVKEINKLLYKQ